MRKSWFAAAVVAVCPAVASAVVTVRVDPGTYVYNGQDQVVDWEVYATGSDPAENERLNAFTLQLNMPSGSPGGIHFVIPAPNERGWIPFDETTKHPYVFAGFPDNGPEDPSAGSNYGIVRLSGVVTVPNESVDIGPDRSGLGKIQVFVPKDSPFWGNVFFEPMFLSMAGPGGSIDVVGQSGSWLVVPEPASAGVMGVAGALVLLRRRRAGGF